MYWTSSASQRNYMVASERKPNCLQWHSTQPKKHSYWALPEIYVSFQKPFIPRITEAEILQTEYVYIWLWHRWAGQAIRDSSRNEGWLSSRNTKSFLALWVHPLASAQHTFLKEYEKYETHAWVAWYTCMRMDRDWPFSRSQQKAGLRQASELSYQTEKDSMWTKDFDGMLMKRNQQRFMCILETPLN